MDVLIDTKLDRRATETQLLRTLLGEGHSNGNDVRR